MLVKVEVRGAQGNLLVLPLEDIFEGLLVEEIEGLDPVKATIVSSSFATVDGSQYQSSRRESRNIKIKLGLEPDPAVDTVRSLRKSVYDFFMPKAPVDLRFFMEDGLTVNISGRVETCDATMFTEEPSVDISIINFDPDFQNLTPTSLSGNTTSTETETLIAYPGTVETGVLFTLNVNRSISEFTIYHRSPSGTIRSMDFSAPLVTGDVLKISSVTGDKGATLTRTSVTSPIMYGVSPQSSWLELSAGDNHIRVYAEGAAIPYTIDYVTRYGGL
jgi:hypothetical protein